MNKSDREFYEIVDVLSREYGWSVEYITELEMNEIMSLKECIENRKEREFNELVLAIRYALSGKPINKQKKRNASKKELERLFKTLGAKEEDIKKGILRI